MTIYERLRREEAERMEAERLAFERFLLDDEAEGAARYEVWRGPWVDRGVFLVAFVTGGVNGKTPDDTAVGNLADLSEHHPARGRLYLYRHDGVRGRRVLLAQAEGGVVLAERVDR